MIKHENKKQLDLHEVAALIGRSWQTVRYQQTTPNKIPHYKRKGDMIKGRHPDGHPWKVKVDPRLKGTRVIFFEDEVKAWASQYLKN